jgi:hypothetical protein
VGRPPVPLAVTRAIPHTLTARTSLQRTALAAVIAVIARVRRVGVGAVGGVGVFVGVDGVSVLLALVVCGRDVVDIRGGRSDRRIAALHSFELRNFYGKKSGFEKRTHEVKTRTTRGRGVKPEHISATIFKAKWHTQKDRCSQRSFQVYWASLGCLANWG